MKELTANEMEYVSGAGLIDLPCALVDFTVQSALGPVAAGINAGMILASSALETTIDLVSNILGGSPSSTGSIITDHINSLLYAESGFGQTLFIMLLLTGVVLLRPCRAK